MQYNGVANLAQTEFKSKINMLSHQSAIDNSIFVYMSPIE